MFSRNLTLLVCLVTIGIAAAWLDEDFQVNGNLHSFSKSMEKMQNEMEQMQNEMEQMRVNMNKNMHTMGQKMRENLEQAKKLNVSDLAIRQLTTDPDIFYDCSGCKCDKLSCECCGLIESLSDSAVCYGLKFSTNDKKLTITKNEINLSEANISELDQVCDSSTCLHFYALKSEKNLNADMFRGCIDLVDSELKIQVKLGCFILSAFSASFDRQATVAHDGDNVEYINEINHFLNITQGLEKSSDVNVKTFGAAHISNTAFVHSICEN